MTTVDPILDIRVYGAPAPQGSKRAVVHKQSGKAVVMESSKRVKTWREDVTAAALATGAGDRPPYDGEVIVSMVFTFARPKSHYRTGRNAHLLRADAPARPGKPPDLSKLLRSTEDALTGVVWTDDARIVEYGRAAKVWAGEDPDALDRPGAVITVWPARLDAVLSGQLGDTGRPADLYEPCDAETRSWDHFTPEQLDSYWIKCSLSLPHDEHEDSHTGLKWRDKPPGSRERPPTDWWAGITPAPTKESQ